MPPTATAGRAAGTVFVRRLRPKSDVTALVFAAVLRGAALHARNAIVKAAATSS